MSERFELSERTISSMIARHKGARSHRRALERSAKSRWSQLRYPMLIFIRWREQKALMRLAGGVPATSDGACSKLLYLMATMIVDGAPSKPDDVATVINTLLPHQDNLSAFLRK